jgi:hypothetical protein
MVRIGAVTATRVTTLMGSNAFAAMEYFDGATGDAHVDLSADQRVQYRDGLYPFLEENLGLRSGFMSWRTRDPN